MEGARRKPAEEVAARQAWRARWAESAFLYYCELWTYGSPTTDATMLHYNDFPVPREVVAMPGPKRQHIDPGARPPLGMVEHDFPRPHVRRRRGGHRQLTLTPASKRFGR